MNEAEKNKSELWDVENFWVPVSTFLFIFCWFVNYFFTNSNMYALFVIFLLVHQVALLIYCCIFQSSTFIWMKEARTRSRQEEVQTILTLYFAHHRCLWAYINRFSTSLITQECIQCSKFHYHREQIFNRAVLQLNWKKYRSNCAQIDSIFTSNRLEICQNGPLIEITRGAPSWK
jgi:hypothetical protein